jgi:hypothetical protein
MKNIVTFSIPIGEVYIPNDYIEFMNTNKTNLKIGQGEIFNSPGDLSQLGKAGDDFWYSILIGWVGDDRIITINYDSANLEKFKYRISDYKENDYGEYFDTLKETINRVKQINKIKR